MQFRSPEWQAVIESRGELARAERAPRPESFQGLSKAEREEIGKRHFDVVVKRVRLRDGETQGDISDLLFALLHEYFLDLPDFKDGS